MNSSTIRLFADECLIYKDIHSQQDAEDLQADLDALQTWERRSLIHGHVLDVADTAKYLGVTLHKHCAWSKHISQTARRPTTLVPSSKGISAEHQYRSRNGSTRLVRPILEYASVVWDPHAESDIYKLEIVQP